MQGISETLLNMGDMMRRLITLVAVSCLSLLVYGQVQKAITPQELVDLRYVADAQVSPDGKWVAFVVGIQQGWSEPRDPHIWIVATDGKSEARPFIASKDGEFSPRWSPDGRFLAFLSSRPNPFQAGDLSGNETIAPIVRLREQERASEKKPDGGVPGQLQAPPTESETSADEEHNTQLWMIRMDGGEAFPLTQVKGNVQSFDWSPNGSRIAFTVRDPLTDEEKAKRKRKDDAQHVDHDFKLARLWTLDFKSGAVKKVGSLELNINDLDWSSDARQLVLRVSKSPRPLDIWYRNKVVIVDAESGAIVRTVSENAGPMDVRWSPDGTRIAFASMSQSGISELPAVADAAGGNEHTVGAQYAGTIWAVKWNGSKEFIAESLEGTSAKLISVDLQSGKTRTIAKLMAEGPDYSLNADGRMVAFIGQEFTSPSNVWVVEAGGVPRRLTNLHPQVASWNLGVPREITWKNKQDGRTIYGVLIIPSDYAEGKKYPLVVDVHGGPEWAWWSGWAGSWHEWGQLLASHGYAVLMPNPRGSDGQGPNFAEAVHADWGGMDFEDILSGVDDLVAKGIADPDRLGIGGWSYGGFMSSWAVGHTNRFKAAVIGAAVTDLVSFYGSTDITPNFPGAYFDGPPYMRRQLYEAHSPLSFVQNAKTPSLILHGEADPRVPITQGWEFYNALRDLGVETEMVTYPREPHGIREPEHEKDVLTRMLAWYDKHLKP